MKKGELKEVYREYQEFENYAKQKNLNPEQAKILSNIYQQRQLVKATRIMSWATITLAFATAFQLFNQWFGSETTKTFLSTLVRYLLLITFFMFTFMVLIKFGEGFYEDIKTWFLNMREKQKDKEK